MKVFLCLFLVLLWKYPITGGKPKIFKFIQKSIKCSYFDPKFISNMTCRIKAVRGKMGLLDMAWRYNNITDSMIEVKVFYRPAYRAQHLQPYLVDVDIELCPMPFVVFNPLSFLFISFFRVVDPGLPKCPMDRQINLTRFDLDDFVKDYDVKFLPMGLFTGVYRLHDKKNHTYYTISHTAEVKAEGAHDLSMIG